MRLKGLEEFSKPAFVGRMDRVRRSRERAFALAMVVTVLIGIAVGLTFA